jgi:parvulin-like peptidyl-prolyl isomerase
VSEIVETRFGYHLIKVFDKKPEARMAYKDVMKDGGLERHLKQQKVREKINLYVEKLKADKKVERFLTALE